MMRSSLFAVPDATGLVRIDPLEACVHPFAVRVRNAQEALKAPGHQEIVSFLRQIQAPATFNTKGYGYLATSLRGDPEREALHTAAAILLMAEIPRTCVVIPYDELLEMPVPSASLHMGHKWNEVVKVVKREIGDNFSLVISGMAESDVFQEDVLSAMPREDRLNHFGPWKALETDVEAYHQIFRASVKEWGFRETLRQRQRESLDPQTALFLGIYLFLSEQGSWQSFSHQCHATLLIPTSFIQAVVRTNYLLVSKQRDFIGERELCAQPFPVSDVVDGERLTRNQLHERLRENFYDGGLPPNEFTDRVSACIRR